MYHLIVRKQDPDYYYSFKGRSADYCVYGNGYRASLWSYTLEEAIKEYLTGIRIEGTLDKVLALGGNHIVATFPFEVLDATYIKHHHPELFI